MLVVGVTGPTRMHLMWDLIDSVHQFVRGMRLRVCRGGQQDTPGDLTTVLKESESKTIISETLTRRSADVTVSTQAVRTIPTQIFCEIMTRAS